MDYIRRFFKTIKITYIRLSKGSEHASIYNRLNTKQGKTSLINPLSTYIKRIFAWQYLGIALLFYTFSGFISLHNHFDYAKPTVAFVTSHLGFKLKHVEVEGKFRLTDNEIIEALGIKEAPSLLFFDVQEARQTLEKIKTVKSASVSRHFPNILRINLQEREPYAIWQDKHQLKTVDLDGIELGSWHGNNVENLPLVVGDNANIHAKEIISVIENFKEINARVKSYVRVSDRRWNVNLDAGLKVMLPEENVIKTIALLNRLHNEHQILDRDLQYIDMRLPNKLVLNPNNTLESQVIDPTFFASSSE